MPRQAPKERTERLKSFYRHPYLATLCRIAYDIIGVQTMETLTPDIPSSNIARHDATGRDAEQYTVSVPEAAEIFTAAGLPRTERAIQRFCKNGDLICAFQETAYGSRYLIRQSSIDRLIQQKLQALAVTPETDDRDASRPVASGREASRQEPDAAPADKSPETLNSPENKTHDSRQKQAETGDDTDMLQQLREENLILKIDNAARQQFINHLTSTVEKYAGEVRELSYNLGVSHTKLTQIEAPKIPDTEPDDMSRPDATGEVAVDIATPKVPETIAPALPKPKGWKRIFG